MQNLITTDSVPRFILVRNSTPPPPPPHPSSMINLAAEMEELGDSSSEEDNPPSSGGSYYPRRSHITWRPQSHYMHAPIPTTFSDDDDPRTSEEEDDEIAALAAAAAATAKNNVKKIRESSECSICYTSSSTIDEYVVFKCGEGHWVCITCANNMLFYDTIYKTYIKCVMCRIPVHIISGLNVHINAANTTTTNLSKWGVILRNLNILRCNFFDTFTTETNKFYPQFNELILDIYFPHLTEDKTTVYGKFQHVQFSQHNKNLIQKLYMKFLRDSKSPTCLYAISSTKDFTAKYPVIRIDFDFLNMTLVIGANSFKLTRNSYKPFTAHGGYYLKDW